MQRFEMDRTTDGKQINYEVRYNFICVRMSTQLGFSKTKLNQNKLSYL